VFPPPPLLKEASDQPLREEAGVGRPRKGLDRSSGDRVHHTSLSVFAPRGTGQVFRPPAGRPDKSSAVVLSKERREAAWSDTSDDPWRGRPSRWRISARSSWRTARPAISATEPWNGTGPHAAIHGLVHFAGDYDPLGSSLDRPRAVRAGSPSPGLRAHHGVWLRAGPEEDPVPAGAPDGLHPRRHHDAL